MNAPTFFEYDAVEDPAELIAQGWVGVKRDPEHPTDRVTEVHSSISLGATIPWEGK